jgi:hypothetical protein
VKTICFSQPLGDCTMTQANQAPSTPAKKTGQAEQSAPHKPQQGQSSDKKSEDKPKKAS